MEGVSTRFVLHGHALLGFNRLVKPSRKAPPRQKPPRKLVNQNNLPALNDIIAIFLMQGMRFQTFVEVMDEAQAFGGINIFYVDGFFYFVNAVLGHADRRPDCLLNNQNRIRDWYHKLYRRHKPPSGLLAANILPESNNCRWYRVLCQLAFPFPPEFYRSGHTLRPSHELSTRHSIQADGKPVPSRPCHVWQDIR